MPRTQSRGRDRRVSGGGVGVSEGARWGRVGNHSAVGRSPSAWGAVAGRVQFLITFGTISYHMYSARILPYFAVFFEIRCILPYFESIDFGQI